MRTLAKVVPLARKLKKTMLHFIHLVYDACDKVSVKLTGISIPFLFIGSRLPNWLGTVTGWLGVIVMLSTLTYNVIKITKELKSK